MLVAAGKMGRKEVAVEVVNASWRRVLCAAPTLLGEVTVSAPDRGFGGSC